MQKRVFFTFFAILVSFSWSVAKQEVELPINVGIGPALFWIPGVVNRELHPAVQLELYAVLTPKILQDNKEKIPKKYRKYVNTEEEMHVAPIWMSLIPKYLIISPREESFIYGGLWSLFGASISFLKTQRIKLNGLLLLPTFTYLYTHAEKNEPDTQHLFGVGAMLKLENTIRFSENFLATLAYGHNLNLPLSINTYKEETKTAEQRWIQAGVLSLVFHFRFNVKQSI